MPVRKGRRANDIEENGLAGARWAAEVDERAATGSNTIEHLGDDCALGRASDDLRAGWQRGRARTLERTGEARDDRVLCRPCVRIRTKQLDRVRKLPLYAKSKLPIYWVINIPERQIEVYTEPRGGKSPTYRQRIDFAIDASVPVAIAGENRGSISVRDILPKLPR